ncbi:MAG: aminopeptidase [SAR324 cluster bacterium]|nr:aminopeptidase [SAR324 cluster bacterium]
MSSCSELGFYWQAASGHLEILNRKQDIQELLESAETSAELKRKLKLVESVRTFASENMGLPDNAAYTAYVDLGRPFVTMVVTAALPLELKSQQWCYWFVGCQEYRGYFDEADAEAFALEMKEQKLDVSVGGVSAYSTLGWLNKPWLPNYFSDPVLSTFLLKHDAELIATLIHEMAHQIVYVNNDTSFNESFAVFVEQEGLRQFLDEAEKSKFIESKVEKTYQWYLSARKDRRLFRQLVNTTFDKMEILFAKNFSDTEKLQKKQQLFAELRENYENRKKEFQVLSYDNWFVKKLNNSHLLGVQRYHSQVEKFALLFEEHGQQWRQFFAAVRKLSKH